MVVYISQSQANKLVIKLELPMESGTLKEMFMISGNDYQEYSHMVVIEAFSPSSIFNKLVVGQPVIFINNLVNSLYDIDDITSRCFTFFDAAAKSVEIDHREHDADILENSIEYLYLIEQELKNTIFEIWDDCSCCRDIGYKFTKDILSSFTQPFPDTIRNNIDYEAVGEDLMNLRYNRFILVNGVYVELITQKGLKMDCTLTKDYLEEKDRMTEECTIDCSDCPLSHGNNGKECYCEDLEKLYPEHAIRAVQQWSERHPIKKKHPNA